MIRARNDEMGEIPKSAREGYASSHDLVILLRQRATLQGDRCAYIFLEDGEGAERRLTYGQVDERARAIAAHLQAMGMAGERALLLYPPGLDYIVAFFACLYAGVVAVPVYPPSRHHLQRLRAIVHDAAPALVLTTAGGLENGSTARRRDNRPEESWGRGNLQWLATDRLDALPSSRWIPPLIEPDALAFLQYTSGSTGEPKGVMVSHANLIANQRAIKEGFRHTEETIVVGWLPFYHDMGLIGNILQPLYLGSTAILMSPLSFLEQPVRWLKAISRYRANTSGGPNFAYDLCVRKVTAEQKRDLDLTSWRVAFNGAEPVRLSTLERFAAAFAECGFRRESFFPCYGLAEATLFVTGPEPGRLPSIHAFDQSSPGGGNGADRAATLVGCGSPPAEHEVRIVHPDTLTPGKEGEVGEIWVAGPSVARGYWNRAEGSERTFRARLADDEGLTFLRTGDLGLLHNGELYVTGRIKDLIILQGRNYYPQDLERVLDEQAGGLRPGCNAAFSVTRGDQEEVVLVAEVSRASQHRAKEILTEVRRRVADASDLPISDLVLVPPGSVPRTSSGKIRRQACKQAYLEGRLDVLARSGGEDRSGSEAPPPTTDPALDLLRGAIRALPSLQRAPLILRFLKAKLAERLRLPESGIRPDLSIRAMGLDSLRTVELKHAVDALLGLETSLSLFLSDATLAELAEGLAEETGRTSPLAGGIPSAKVLEETDGALSFPQEAIFTVHRLEPDSISYNLHLALRIHGSLDPKFLRCAIDQLIGRHEMLRTVYRADGETVLQSPFSPDVIPEYFSEVDAGHWSESLLQEDLSRRARAPFDLTQGPVLRVTLYRQDEKKQTLLFCVHHIALDLWSLLIFLKELMRAYEALTTGDAPRLPPITTRYRDFVAWQQEYLKSPAAEEAWRYWEKQLSGELPLLALPIDFPRPPTPGYGGASVPLRLGTSLTSSLRALAQARSMTLFTLLLAVYKVLLHRYSGQRDLLVGSASSGRAQGRMAALVGNLVNPIALRTRPSPDEPFSAYLAQVREAVLDALAHQEFPFPLIVERLQPKRHADQWPIFQTMFILQQAQSGVEGEWAQWALGEEGSPLPWLPWGGGTVEPLAVRERVENFDLKVMAAEEGEGLLVSFQYRSDLFKRETIARMAGHFRRLLEGIAADPDLPLSALPLLTEDEKREIVRWNATETRFQNDQPVHRRFESEAKRRPDAVAVVFEDRCLTYEALNARANRVAHRLRAEGVGPESVVALCAHRSVELVIGLLGILKAGGIYLPLDPDHPRERLAALISEAQPRLVLVQPELSALLPSCPGPILPMDADLTPFAGQPETNLEVTPDGEQIAYLLYTSGSTGRPKGVAIPHQGLTNRLLWMQEHFRLNETDAVLQKTPYTFDVSVWEFFWPLIAGARLIVAGPDDHKEPERLIGLIERHAATTVHFVPSMLRAFLESADLTRCGSLKRVIGSGEALTADLQRRFFERLKAELHNLYGPTEASIDVTAWACSQRGDEAGIPIGWPIANTRIYLLDDRFNPVPVGVAGELCIGGIQLARGYLHRPDLTAASFIPDPFSGAGERLYRTGDLARYRPDGAIEYLGRRDHQVKVRGFRIELGEIEARLLDHPQVRAAAVLAREDRPGDKRLAAYVVPVQPGLLSVDTLREFLREALPEYMLPSAFVWMEEWPLTSSGKLDRKALPAPDIGAEFAGRYAAPRTPTEEILAKIWGEVLGVGRVGIHDNFFELGGDSILSIQAAGRAMQAGIRLPPRLLFQHPTVAVLAQVAASVPAAETEQGLVTGEAPLTPIQRWFFAGEWANPHHWNQALLLETPPSLKRESLERAVRRLVLHHDALRLRFSQEGDIWRQFHAPEPCEHGVEYEDLSEVPDEAFAEGVARRAEVWQGRLNHQRGPLFRAVWFDPGPRRSGRLLLIAHHLVVDAVSWRILLEDLDTLYRQIEGEKKCGLSQKTTSYRQWALRLQAYASSVDAIVQDDPRPIPPLPVDDPTGGNREGDACAVTVTLDTESTRALAQEVPRAYRTGVQEMVLAALGEVIGRWAGRGALRLDMEGHGRDNLFSEIDLTRTVGWFTTLFPIRLDLPSQGSPAPLIKGVKEQVRRAAQNGFDRSVRRWLLPNSVEPSSLAPILFNYLGHLDRAGELLSCFRTTGKSAGPLRDPRNARRYEWEILASIAEGRIKLEWRYSAARYASATIERLAGDTIRRLEALISHCLEPASGGLTPSDFPLASLTQEELDALPFDPRGIEEIYPLAPMQEGLLFHSLMHPGSGIYHMQDRYGISGRIDVDAFRKAWQRVLDRHPILRTSFLWERCSRPHQVVHRRVTLPFEFLDWRALPEDEQKARLEALLGAERKEGFDLSKPPLMRIRLLRLGEERYRLIRSHHHILMDAWCTSLILIDFKEQYEALVHGSAPPERVVPPFRDYIAWLQRQDHAAAERFWRVELQGFTEPTPLVFDRPSAAETAGVDIDDAVTFLSEETTATLHALAQRCSLTPNTFVQGAWALLLSRYAGRGEVLFGVTVAGRPTDLPGIESVLGLFINSLPLRVQVRPEEPALDFLQRLLRQNLEMRQYEYTPLVRIQAVSEIPRGRPLFEHLLVFENTPLDPTLRSDWAGLKVIDVENRTHTNYPITAVVIPGPRLHLQITYERSRFDAGAVERMLGHFKSLLENLIRNLEAKLCDIGLLTETERRQTVVEWNRTEQGDPGAADPIALFEAQAGKTPDAVAVTFRGDALTYRELNDRADRVAQGLAARGVGPESVVALLNERGIDLLVMILAVFKTGGAYLPLDPNYPQRRLQEMIRSSRPTAVIDGKGGTEQIGPPLEGPQDGPKVFDLTELEREGQSGERLPPRGDGRTLAYVIYTSGSTGIPKGAMVERAGMVNNLLSKIAVMGLTPRDVIAQTASHCFDISVWQFLTPLFCGARVHIFPDAVVHDPQALLREGAAQGVTVLELVPSLIRSLLDMPEVALPHLRWLLPTGEAFPYEWCRRWMERYPHVSALNAYGPAECADDVAYHRVDAASDAVEASVPIGRPVENIRLYILDRWLQPVPAGVPGELCVAGIGVGRGYLNQPHRTAESFIPDPFGDAPGGRLYRTGDLARYRPDGTIEFLGRIDHQVKVRGYRIELGEIEARLLSHPDVGEAVVVAREDHPGEKRLAAYLVLRDKEDREGAVRLKAHLREWLPDYMIPAAFVFLDTLPLNPNGKVDRKALPSPDVTERLADRYVAPRNPTEELLAQIWAAVLRVERVGIYDNFFELGGDSILSIQIVSRANQAGLSLTPRDLFDHPQIADLAPVAHRAPRIAAEQGTVQGKTPLTPIQKWFFEQKPADPDHWNQAVLLECREPIAPAILKAAARHLLEHHDALRMRFRREGEEWRQINLAEEPQEIFFIEDLSTVGNGEQAAVTRTAQRWQESLKLMEGPLLRVVWLDLGPARPARLLIVIHHLVVDAVSWRILLEDLESAYRSLAQGKEVSLPAKTTSFREWAGRLRRFAESDAPADADWGETVLGETPPLPVDAPEGGDIEACTEEASFTLTERQTGALLQEVPPVYRTQINDLLLAALASTICGWSRSDSVLIHLEGHGREDLFPDVDLSRTVGWFTSLFPVRLRIDVEADPGRLLKSVKEQLRAVPRNGISYGVRRYLSSHGSVGPKPQISFNYLGQLDQALPADGLFAAAAESAGTCFGPRNARMHEWEIVGYVLEGRFRLFWRYSRERYRRETIESLCRCYQSALESLIDHCLSPRAGGCTPSDFPLASLNQGDLDRFIADPRNVEEVYPLGSMQEGLLLHTLMNPHSGIYLMQDRYEIRGRLDIDAFRKGWQQVVDTHSVLRTAFVWDTDAKPHQIVYRNVAAPFEFLDWRDVSKEIQDERLCALLRAELEAGLPLDQAPILRIRLIRMEEERWVFFRSHHHILMDAWCLSLLLTDFLAYYGGWVNGKPIPDKRVTPYRDYIAWLQKQDLAAAEAYWRNALKGFAVLTHLAASRPPVPLPPNEPAVADEILFLSENDTAALHALAKRHRLTPNTFLQGAWALLMSHYTDRSEALFGVTVAGRPAGLEGVEEMVGLFINSLPLPVQVRPEAPLLDWLQDLQARNIEMRQFEYAPLGQIQQWSEAPRGQPLFDTLLVFENVPVDPSLRGGALALNILGYESRTHTNYPLTVVLIPEKALHLQLTYDRSRFDAAAVFRMLAHYKTLLESMVRRPEARLDDLSLLPWEEAHRVLVQWNDTGTEPTVEFSYQRRFEAQAARTPEAIAAVCGGAEITYADLNAGANRIAHALIEAGVGPETIVAVMNVRGIDFLRMVLGILKAGGAYLPLDPDHPAPRLLQILASSRPAVVLTRSEYLQRVGSLFSEIGPGGLPRVIDADAIVGGAWSENNPPIRSRGENLAYVLYTSGSTGIPKGALVEQRGMMNNFQSKISTLGLGPEDVIAQTASQCFDISVWQLLTPLLCGARVHIIPDAVVRDPQSLMRELSERGVTVLELVPSLLQALLDVPGIALPRLRWLLPTGEALPAPLCRRWMETFPEVALLNAYGPAECSDDVAYHRIKGRPPGEGTVPIGRPIENLRLYILNRFLRPAPVGVIGELFVGGVGVGRGYLGDPVRTAESFIPDPFGAATGGRLYKTGDLARFRNDGVIEFLGRADHQVKVRGHRIELGEVEARLMEHPQIREAAALAREFDAGDTRLVAYVVSNGGASLDPDSLRRFVKQTLPDYMAPSAFVFLDALPRTPNGKIDRKGLPQVDFSGTSQTCYTAPRTETEKALAAIWAEVLKVGQVGAENDFFELGGHSLLATQILSRVRAAFQVELPLFVLFEATTVAALARAVDATRAMHGDSEPLASSPGLQLEEGEI